MPQYLLSVWHDDDYVVDFSADEMQQTVARVGAFNDEVTAAGALVFAGGLQPSASATVLTMTDGAISTNDGPYAQEKRQMGGFWVVEADDTDAALAWARKATVACGGPVELRPFQTD